MRDQPESLFKVAKSEHTIAAFIDRDGTINVDKGHVHRVEDLEYIPGALDALRLASDHGVLIFVVTNQAGIAKGMYGETEFLALTESMLEQMGSYGIRVKDVLYCPHHPQATVQKYRRACECRKPAPGLLRGAMEREKLLATDSVMIGDKNSDIEAGRALGLRTYLVETGYGVAHKATTRADFVVSDLWEAMVHLLSSRTGVAHTGQTPETALPKEHT